MAQAGKVRLVRFRERVSPEEQLKQIGEYLRTPPPDWNSIWLRLALSPLGREFPFEKFLRTPCKTIGKCIDAVDNLEQHQANRDSMTQAQTTHLLLMLGHAYSGSKKAPPKAKPVDFLPYPKFKGARDEHSGPDPTTQFVLTEVARQRRIPAYVLAALMTRAD